MPEFSEQRIFNPDQSSKSEEGTPSLIKGELEIAQEKKEIKQNELKENLPKVDSEKGYYEDKEGQRWKTASKLATENHTSKDSLYKFEDIRTQSGYVNGRIQTLYNEDDVLTALSAVNRVDKETGAYIDKEGQRWVLIKKIVKDWHVAIPTVLGLANVRTLPGGGWAVLYNEQDVLRALQEKGKLNPREEVEKLPKADREGIYLDDSGEKWRTIGSFMSEFLVSYATFTKLLNIRTLRGRDLVGKTVSLYNEKDVLKALFEKKVPSRVDAESIPQVDENGVYIDPENNRWVSAINLTSRWYVFHPALKRLKEVRTISGRNKKGRQTILYNEKDVLKALEHAGKLITKEEAEKLPRVDADSGLYVDKAGELWGVSRALAKHWLVGHTAVESLPAVRTLVGLNQQGGIATLYNELDIRNAIELKGRLLSRTTAEDLPQINDFGRYIDENGQSWRSSNSLAAEWVLPPDFLAELNKLPSILGRATNSRVVKLYRETDLLGMIESSPKLLSREDFDNLPQVDNATGIYIDSDGQEWTTASNLSSKWLFTSLSRLENVRTIPGRSKIGGKAELYNIKDFLKTLQEEDRLVSREEAESLPRVDSVTGIYKDIEGNNWRTSGGFIAQWNVYHAQVPLLKNVKTITGRDQKGQIVELYNETDVLNALNEIDYFVKKDNKREQKKVLELEGQLKNYVIEIGEQTSVDAKEFKELIGLFGASSAIDILFHSHPDFKDIPLERVKKVIADYLGDFLSVKGGFSFDNLNNEIANKYLSESAFQDALFEVVKQDCLSFYNNQRDLRSSETDRDVIDLYFWQLEDKKVLENPFVKLVAARAKEYYRAMFEDVKKASNLVDYIKQGRSFPDIYQSLNIREIAEKKRMLIADEMGLGKSATAIMAKESLDVKCAILTVPSNVVATWRDYLSSRQSENGDRIGYFKEGQEPKVLIIESLESLRGVDSSLYDYIIISHERLNEGYAQQLETIDAGMLIVDEMHKLKNIQGGVRAGVLLKLAMRLEGENKYLALLSGTPIPNKVEDIAMVLKLLYSQEFGAIDNKELVGRIIHGAMGDIRSLLIPRMQMKSLAESVDMPKLHERIQEVELSDLEKKVYQVLLEEDELTATVKMKMLRQFLLNPDILDATPGLPCAKLDELQRRLDSSLVKRDKIVVFFNGYIEGVIRGENNILDRLSLSSDVEVLIIDGSVSQEERQRIQLEFNTSDKKMVLLISGQTADVGVDLSGGQEVIHYNEPWTRYEERQQVGRVYRPGLKDDLDSTIIVAKDTIEEGMRRYILLKEKAIEKLLRGIPITELEQEMLETSERQADSNLEVNKDLAEYYFSSWDKMMKIFSYVKEIGEGEFTKFLSEFGREYAQCYLDLGARNYQSNANRVAATLIDNFVRQAGSPTDVNILDIASGPDMLKRHSLSKYQNSITSLDINDEHFKKEQESQALVGSFRELPFENNSFEFANLALALHYTKFIPSQGIYERLEVLREMNRVLKVGGKGIVTMIYSLDLKHPDHFKEIVESCGFALVPDYSGRVSWGDSFQSDVFTLEKVSDVAGTVDEQVSGLGKEVLNGLKFKRSATKLKNSRHIIPEFSLQGQEMRVRYNMNDAKVLEQEEKILAQGKVLKDLYGDVRSIPRDEVVNSGFVRIFNGSKYVLFKTIDADGSVVVIP